MWQGILGHDEIVERFRRTLERGRLASTYLFVGPSGIGKRRFALELARALLCSESSDASLSACGQCESCRLFAAGTHPDLVIVERKPDKQDLLIKQFIGEGDAEFEKGLCLQLALTPYLGRRKIGIIVDADHFNQESANCLLKTLEEPPVDSLLILIGTSSSRQLPTIRSRSQVVRFYPLEPNEVALVLVEAGLADDPQQAAAMARVCEGSIERAIALAEPSLWEFRHQLFRDLQSRRPDSVRMARSVQAFVDEAGNESRAKRDRLNTIISFAIEFYRSQLVPASVSNSAAIDHANAEHCADGGETAVRALECSLETLESIDRYANLGLIIQHWCEALADLELQRK